MLVGVSWMVSRRVRGASRQSAPKDSAVLTLVVGLVDVLFNAIVMKSVQCISNVLRAWESVRRVPVGQTEWQTLFLSGVLQGLMETTLEHVYRQYSPLVRLEKLRCVLRVVSRR